MKKIFIILMVFFISCISIPKIDPATLISEKIFEFPGKNKNELYEKSKQWLSYSFREGKSIIDYDNKETGKIIGNIITSCGAPGNLRSKITIDIKNNKTKLHILAITIISGWSEIPVYGGCEGCMTEVYPKILEDYEIFMKTKESKNW